MLNRLLGLDGHCRQNVAALLRASIFFVRGGRRRLVCPHGPPGLMLDLIRVRVRLLGLVLHKLHSAHLQFLNRCHVNLGHVVSFVARVDVLGDRLSLLQDEGSPVFRGSMAIGCARRRRLLEAVKYRHLIVLASLLTCLEDLVPARVPGRGGSLVIV